MNVFDEMFDCILSDFYGHIDLNKAINDGMLAQRQLSGIEIYNQLLSQKIEKELSLIEIDAKVKPKSFNWYHC